LQGCNYQPASPLAILSGPADRCPPQEKRPRVSGAFRFVEG
jgi:hypothetical protein